MFEHSGQLITNSDEITTVMQQWYEKTAERTIPQMEALTDFLARSNLELPQLDEDQKAMLEEYCNFSSRE
jgi:hypothetical protein